MHLHTLYKHKEVSLLTFKAFVEGAEDPKIKDAILLQATKSIFDIGDTGYLSSKESTVTGFETIKIVENLKDK
jgi:hypothetical protein